MLFGRDCSVYIIFNIFVFTSVIFIRLFKNMFWFSLIMIASCADYYAFCIFSCSKCWHEFGECRSSMSIRSDSPCTSSSLGSLSPVMKRKKKKSHSSSPCNGRKHHKVKERWRPAGSDGKDGVHAISKTKLGVGILRSDSTSLDGKDNIGQLSLRHREQMK